MNFLHAAKMTLSIQDLRQRILKEGVSAELFAAECSNPVRFGFSMSQVKFKTSLPDGTPIEVVSGWDEPLHYYHLTVFYMDDRDEECLYSCLDEDKPFSHKDLNAHKATLKRLGINAPDGFWERAERKAGNVTHIFENGIWNEY